MLSHKTSGRSCYIWPVTISCRSLILASYLDMENVIEKAVELFFQQCFDSVLNVGLSFFVVFTNIQT